MGVAAEVIHCTCTNFSNWTFMYLVFISAVSYLHVQLRGGERGQVGCVRAGDTDTTSCSGEMGELGGYQMGNIAP